MQNIQIGSRIFSLTVNTSLFNGSIFKIKEYVVEDVATGNYTLILRDSTGEELMLSTFKLQNKPDRHCSFFGQTFFATSFADLDVLIQTCWYLLREQTQSSFKTIKRETELVSLPIDEYLVTKGIDVDELISEMKELSTLETLGTGDFFFELKYEYSYYHSARRTFIPSIDLTQIKFFSRSEIQSLFDTEDEDYDVDTLEEVLSDSSLTYCRVYKYLGADIYPDEEIDFVDKESSLWIEAGLTNDTELFHSCSYMNYSPTVTVDELLAAYEAVRLKSFANLRSVYAFFEKLNNVLSEKIASYQYIEQYYLD